MKHHKILASVIALIITAVVMTTSVCLAQDNQTPIEISADQTLEWNQQDKQYTANGNVVVVQGTMTLKADQLIADYHDEDSSAKNRQQKEGSPNIWQLTAIGNVQVTDTGRILYADTGIYNLETENVVATGNNLKLKTDDMTVTARDKMTYDAKNNIAKAIGKAHLKKGQDDIWANTLTANMTRGNDGKLSLKSAKANGNVKITTAEEVLTGNNGIYNLGNETATITGKVTITRGENKLNGEKATLNLKTGVSKMFAAKKSGAGSENSRVRGIFYPGSAPKQSE